MTKIQDILTPHRVLIDCHIGSKKRALELLAKLLSEDLEDTISVQTILEGFLTREKLGSTVITDGIAVPHTRLEHIKKPIAAFIRLHESIPYDDEHDASLLFGIVMPANDKEQHVSVLTCLAECFHTPERIQKIQSADSVDTVFELLTTCQADVNLE